MHVVVAPDKFKGSLSAREVADAVSGGIRDVVPDADVRWAPIADGGEGTLEAVLAAGYRRREVTVSGPTGEPVEAAIGISEGVAVVELAQASGLALLPDGTPAPLTASSYGTGELIAAALDAGARTVVLGLGGSACTDGGAGMLAALGARATDADGRAVEPAGGMLESVASLDTSALDPRLRRVRVVLASDVDSPLLGPHGAARMFARQKGAEPAEVLALEVGLRRWSDVVATATGTRRTRSAGAGAAGGVGFAALAVLGARRRSGIGTVLDLVGMPERLRGAALVVTGEGSLDAQSLHGKAPVGVAEAAYDAGVPVIAVAGRCTLSAAERAAARFRAVYALADIEPDPSVSLGEAGRLLREVGGRIAVDWLAGDEGPSGRESGRVTTSGVLGAGV